MSLAKRSEKGLLTPDNCVVALIDHQPQMLFGITSIDRQTLINNVVGFSKATKVFGVPTILAAAQGAVPRHQADRTQQHELLGRCKVRCGHQGLRS